MNLRGFIAALLSLPLVARFARRNEVPRALARRTLTVHRLDDMPVVRIMMDVYVPIGHAYAMRGNAYLNPVDCPRTPPNGRWSPAPDDYMGTAPNFECWTA